MIAPARLAAYEMLRALASGRSDLPTAIAASRGSLNDDRDKALAAEVATGVQRHRAALDHVIAYFAKRPLTRLDPDIIDILRLSTYQLLHLTRVPASAVVDDAVNMTGKIGKRSASGLVNAVLRSLSRSRTELPLPPKPAAQSDRAAALEYLSVTLSHPAWLASRWLDRLGFERAEAWMLFNNRPAHLTLRANRWRIGVEDLQKQLAAAHVVTTRGRFAPDALVVDEGYALRTPEFGAGMFVVQDEASQLVTLLAGERPGDRLLDVCASPGGKTTAFAAAMHGEGLVIACDVRERRISLLSQTTRASGVPNVRIVQADVLAPVPFRQTFDTVVLDAPCSGLGTLRRDPDIRWRRLESDLLVLADAQRRMLRNASRVVQPGGRLIYATCSSEPEENEDIVDAFLRDSPEFHAVDARTVHQRLPAAVIDTRGHLRTEPDRHGLECFFGAVFERRVT